jgi:hypothetical protein
MQVPITCDQLLPISFLMQSWVPRQLPVPLGRIPPQQSTSGCQYAFGIPFSMGAAAASANVACGIRRAAPRIRHAFRLQIDWPCNFRFLSLPRTFSSERPIILDQRWKPDPISSRKTQVARVTRACFPLVFFTERGASINRMRGGSPILIRSASRWRTVI